MLKSKKYTLAQVFMSGQIVNFAFKAGNVAITNSRAALLAAFTTLKGLVISIEDMFTQYDQIITGWAEQKRLARLALANTTYTIVKAVRAYAIANNDWTLADDMKTSLSVLKKMGYKTILIKVNGWINTVSSLISSLGGYGVDTTLFNQWKTDRDTLTNLRYAPKDAIIARTIIGTNIETTTKDAMTLTKTQIDEIVANLMSSQPDYYNTYFQTRRIDGPGSTHTKFDATIVDELGQPVPNAIVTVDEVVHTAKDGNTTTYQPVSAITAADGTAVVNTFFACPRTITVSGPGIITNTFGPFPFVHGETITQTLTVQPSFNNLPESKATTVTTEPTTTTETTTENK